MNPREKLRTGKLPQTRNALDVEENDKEATDVLQRRIHTTGGKTRSLQLTMHTMSMSEIDRKTEESLLDSAFLDPVSGEEEKLGPSPSKSMINVKVI